MKKYIYKNQQAAPYDTIEAIFKFMDVDGNQVEGACSRPDLLGLLEALGDIMIGKFHSTVNEASSWTNGIIDVSKPIHITITPHKPCE